MRAPFGVDDDVIERVISKHQRWIDNKKKHIRKFPREWTGMPGKGITIQSGKNFQCSKTMGFLQLFRKS